MSGPAVVVLLATHNGERFVESQVESILGQEDIDVRLVVNDDASIDSTARILCRLSVRNSRVTILPLANCGSAPANFFHLLRSVDMREGELVALADQDDVWHPRKLAEQVAVMRANSLDGVSSNVTAFGEGMRPVLIRKAYPQRRWDYVMESPGPGSTFVMSQRLVRVVNDLTRDPALPGARVDYHDWLIYAAARAKGWRWEIMDRSLVDYRQHESNTMGANAGTSAARNRLELIRSRWHRQQVGLILDAVIPVARPDIRQELNTLAALVAQTGPVARLELAARAQQLRRRPRDRWTLAGLIAAGIW